MPFLLHRWIPKSQLPHVVSEEWSRNHVCQIFDPDQERSCATRILTQHKYNIKVWGNNVHLSMPNHHLRKNRLQKSFVTRNNRAIWIIIQFAHTVTNGNPKLCYRYADIDRGTKSPYVLPSPHIWKRHGHIQKQKLAFEISKVSIQRSTRTNPPCFGRILKFKRYLHDLLRNALPVGCFQVKNCFRLLRVFVLNCVTFIKHNSMPVYLIQHFRDSFLQCFRFRRDNRISSKDNIIRSDL